MLDEDDEQERGPSKSARKREMDALQALGTSLIEYDTAVLETLPISAELLRAVTALRGMKERGALRRQRQFIGKLMRNEDADGIREALAERQREHDRAINISHQVEDWRERLLTEGSTALEAVIAAVPAIDRQQLRQLVSAAQRERAAGKPPTASRKLFRLLRDTFTAAQHDDA